MQKDIGTGNKFNLKRITFLLHIALINIYQTSTDF